MSKGKNWFMTMNNPTVTLEEFLDKLRGNNATYARAQHERGAEGTSHYQAVVGYSIERRHGAMTKTFPGVHIEKSKNALASWRYCGKDDTRVEGPVEFGVPPAAKNVKGDTKARNAMIIAHGVVKAVDDGLIPIEKLKQVK